jgi:hypothetical protein
MCEKRIALKRSVSRRGRIRTLWEDRYIQRGAVMKFKNITRTLVCVYLALAAHSAFAALSGNKRTGKLCSNFIAGGGLVDVTVENLSRNALAAVTVTVERCTSEQTTNCAMAGQITVPTLNGGDQFLFVASAPPTHWYLIIIQAVDVNFNLVKIVYQPFLVQP